MKKFICKDGASNYYLVDDGMGGFLNPPKDAEHNYSIAEFRGGHNCGGYSLRGCLNIEWLPQQVKHAARHCLNSNKPEMTEEWVKSVYAYFKHCYSKDGQDRNASDCLVFGKFWDNAEQEKEYPAEKHLGYLFVKSFFPDHTIRMDLIDR